ncbi:MAG TPA: hypothetical protein DGT21_01330 [Armatimonadetes bacterium]|nr:hypothetical protein [Armatimonadota bacterium]
MEFPLAHIPFALEPYLIALGFAAGVCGGLWGMGGGWIIIPALQAIGTEVHVAIGTSVAQILGNSLISSLRHWGFGNVSLRLVLVMVPGQFLGIEIGVRILEHFKHLGPRHTDVFIGVVYVALLAVLAAFIVIEVFRTLRRRPEATKPAVTGDARTPDHVGAGLACRVQALRLYPCISCKVSDIRSISVWVVLATGIAMGVTTGLLGVGGGLLGMPVLVYVIGCPTPVAVGTSVASTICSALLGTFRHAMHANVDLPLALSLLAGASLGVQFGAFATRYVRGVVIRGLFAVMATMAALSVVLNVFYGMRQTALWVVAGTLLAISVTIMVLLVSAVRAEAHMRSSNSP